jgi:uncharacterized membrane protein
MKKINAQFIQKWFIVFWIYAIIGWCYEVILETFIYRWGFSNRGVLFGPYCPVYGVGALTFIICCNKLKTKTIVNNKILNEIIKVALTFLICMCSATLIELIASYILEFFTGKWLWMTYVNYKYNFQGRIALSTSLRFGLGGLAFLYLVQPLIDKAFSKSNKRVIKITSIILLVIVIIDMVYTFIID